MMTATKSAIVKDCRQRGAKRFILLVLADMLGADGAARFRHADLADVVAIHPDTIGAYLRALRDEGEIEYARSANGPGAVSEVRMPRYAATQEADKADPCIGLSPAREADKADAGIGLSVRAAPGIAEVAEPETGLSPAATAREADAGIGLIGLSVVVSGPAAPPHARTDLPPPEEQDQDQGGDESPPLDREDVPGRFERWLPFHEVVALDLEGHPDAWINSRDGSTKADYGRISDAFGDAAGDDLYEAIDLWITFVAEKRAARFRSGEPVWQAIRPGNALMFSRRWLRDRSAAIAAKEEPQWLTN